MMRSLLLLLLADFTFGQDDPMDKQDPPAEEEKKPEEKKPVEDKKQFEKRVNEAIANYQKAIKGATQAGKAQAIAMLDGLCHEKVIAELGNAMKDDPLVRKEVIKVLSKMDHPMVGKVFAANIKLNTKDLEMIKTFLKAMETCMTDDFVYAFGLDLAKQAFQGEFAEPYWDYMALCEKRGAIHCVDGLIKVLYDIEEGKRFGFRAKDDDFENKVRQMLKQMTIDGKSDANQYKSAWPGMKSANVPKYTFEMYCPSAQKRWDRKGSDTKATCPFHDDKKAAQKCPSVVALTCIRQ